MYRPRFPSSFLPSCDVGRGLRYRSPRAACTVRSPARGQRALLEWQPGAPALRRGDDDAHLVHVGVLAAVRRVAGAAVS